MLGYSDNDSVDHLPGVISAEELAETVVQGLQLESFLILPHPDVAQYIQFKSADYDKWLGAMRKLRRKIIDEVGNTELTEMHKLI